jgi:hypothetical protein
MANAMPTLGLVARLDIMRIHIAKSSGIGNDISSYSQQLQWVHITHYKTPIKMETRIQNGNSSADVVLVWACQKKRHGWG